jgi:beta-glucosidase
MVTVSVDVTNTSEVDGEEVVQFYIHETDTPDPRPLLDLRGFERVKINAGETVTVSVELSEDELAYYHLEDDAYTLDPGRIEIYAGPSSDKEKLLKTVLEVK